MIFFKKKAKESPKKEPVKSKSKVATPKSVASKPATPKKEDRILTAEGWRRQLLQEVRKSS